VRLLARIAGLFVVVVVVGGLCSALAHALGASEVVAAILGWWAGIGAAVATSRLPGAAKRKRATARIERDRAMGEQLRREDPRRYRDLLGASTETLAAIDPDAYVGRHVRDTLDGGCQSR
jgi:hypothetical protein